MLPAASFDDILQRAPALGVDEDPLGQRLISLIFARPSSPVWRDLVTNYAFLDARSGDSWDLFFVGMSAYMPMEYDATLLYSHRHEPKLYMNHRAFSEVEVAVRRAHLRALEAEGRGHEVWQYSGETDLVSFMCYGRCPDWLSTCSIRIEERMTGRPLSLGRLTEGLTRWQVDDIDGRFMPGNFHHHKNERYVTSLRAALSWSASAITAGALGNSAYDLIKLLLR